VKVAVDARLLSRPLTGIGRYTYEMCNALLGIEGIILYLYSPGVISGDVRKNLSPARIRDMTWNNGMLRQLWSETYLPMWAKLDEVDVFWGPAHRLPRLLPKNIPRVVTIHDLVWRYAGETMSSATYFLEKTQMPFAVRSADIIVADSYSTADAVTLEFNTQEDQVVVVPLAAKDHKEPAALVQQENLDVQQPYLLFVGTLEPRKNLTRLLEAYARLPVTVKVQANLVIAGGKGWGNVSIENEILRLNLSEHVRLLGYVNEKKLDALYSYAEFIAMPSLYEGFGLPLLEAMIHGVPVLTANNSSMPEVAGEAGLLVDAKDIHSIENGLKQLITDRDLRGELAAKAKENAKRFSWDNSAQQLVLCFERAISTRRGYFDQKGLVEL